VGRQICVVGGPTLVVSAGCYGLLLACYSACLVSAQCLALFANETTVVFSHYIHNRSRSFLLWPCITNYDIKYSESPLQSLEFSYSPSTLWNLSIFLHLDRFNAPFRRGYTLRQGDYCPPISINFSLASPNIFWLQAYSSYATYAVLKPTGRKDISVTFPPCLPKYFGVWVLRFLCRGFYLTIYKLQTARPFSRCIKERSVAFKIHQDAFSAAALPRTPPGKLTTLLRTP